MTQEGFKRKLTSIFSADAVGYSRLMGEDEAATVRTITAYRKVISTLINQHNGHVVDSPGDNLLAEFVSVVDAVQCAVAVQKELKSRNDELPENRKMQFRIGINLGDVIQEENRIYGDGVNIAARLEALAEPGGICISKTAFDHIESKLPYGYEFLGDQSVKNIAKPVGAYRVLMEPRVTFALKREKEKRSSVRRMPIIVWIAALMVLVLALGVWRLYVRRPTFEPASVDKMAYSLPDKPSIAVLPFDNLSGKPDQDFISDGISESIISALSRISEIFVVARNSTFIYKGKAVEVKRVAEDLGVRYVLEGSYQKSQDKIRVTVQLIDAVNGYHLWSERYDRQMKDFLKLLDEITIKIVTTLQVKLTHGEHVHFWSSMTNFQAWSYTVEGYSLWEKRTKADNTKARELFEKALETEPENAFILTMLAWTHYMDAMFGFSKSPADSFNQAVLLAQKITTLDDTVSWVHILWAYIYLFQRQYDNAIAAGEKSIELEPNNSSNQMGLAMIMVYAGKYEEAVVLAERGMRLSPYCPAWFLLNLGLAYRGAGRYQDAIQAFQKLLERAEKGDYPLWLAHSALAITYAMMGQYEKAKMHIKEVKNRKPDYSIESIRTSNFYKDQAQVERMVDALGKAGLN